MVKRYINNSLISLLAVMSLAGCGGGGGGSAPSTVVAPSAPTLNAVTYDLKQLVFTWSAVSGATYYKLNENPDGASGYTQIGGNLTTTTYSHSISVHLQDWVNASYILEACNATGCTSSAAVQALDSASAIGYFKASNTGAGDEFGYAVALSGDGSTLAIGARHEDSNTTGVGFTSNDLGTETGAVYVFSNVSGSWTQQAGIKAPDVDANDDFGSSLSISQDGSTLVVGVANEDSAATGVFAPTDGGYAAAIADETAGNAGAAYVYSRSGTAWSLQAYIKAPNTGAGDLFGRDVDLSADGNTLVVGANGEASNATGPFAPTDGGYAAAIADGTAAAAGAAYVYTRAGTAWSLEAYIKASNAEASDSFGWTVDLSDDGNTLAVGAIWEGSGADGVYAPADAGYAAAIADNAALKSGASYVYTRAGTTWSLEAYVKATNSDADDNYGESLALSSDGNTLAVGANLEDSNATGPFAPADAGYAAAIADGSASAAGAGYVYSRSGATWTPQAYLKASNAAAGDGFGYAMALSNDGNRLLVSAWAEDSSATGIDGSQVSNAAAGSGAAYYYTRSGTTWTQSAYVKASNTGGNDLFGTDVDVSDDAAVLLVGGSGESSNATGVSGTQTDNSASVSGAGYLY